MWTTKPAFKFSLDSEPPGWLIGFFFFYSRGFPARAQ
jgi:hypothetical protein